MDDIRDEHRVHLIISHLVWTPKRPKAILRGAIARDCRHLTHFAVTAGNVSSKTVKWYIEAPKGR